MTESLTLQGRQISPAELHGLRQWVEENPHWSRWRLSRELATRWDWRNSAGVLKDMAARTLLVKLAQRGLIDRPRDRASQVWSLRQALLTGGKHCPAACATGAAKQVGAGSGRSPAVESL